MEKDQGNFFSLSLDEQEELVLGLEQYHKYSEGNTKAITKEELSNLETPIVQAIFKFLMADPDAHKVPFKAESFLNAFAVLRERAPFAASKPKALGEIQADLEAMLTWTNLSYDPEQIRHALLNYKCKNHSSDEEEK